MIFSLCWIIGTREWMTVDYGRSPLYHISISLEPLNRFQPNLVYNYSSSLRVSSITFMKIGSAELTFQGPGSSRIFEVEYLVIYRADHHEIFMAVSYSSVNFTYKILGQSVQWNLRCGAIWFSSISTLFLYVFGSFQVNLELHGWYTLCIMVCPHFQTLKFDFTWSKHKRMHKELSGRSRSCIQRK